MDGILVVALGGSPNADWARWFADVMTSWAVQLAILLLWAGLGLLLALHAEREWEHGLRNRYLQAVLLVGGIFCVLQFVFASSAFGWTSWPAWPFVIETILLFALWLYAFVRFMTRRRSGEGDAESRARGAALDDFIQHEG